MLSQRAGWSSPPEDIWNANRRFVAVLVAVQVFVARREALLGVEVLEWIHNVSLYGLRVINGEAHARRAGGETRAGGLEKGCILLLIQTRGRQFGQTASTK